MARMQDFTPFIPGFSGTLSGPKTPCRRAPRKRGGRNAMRTSWAPNNLCGLPKLIWQGPTWPLKYFLSFKPWSAVSDHELDTPLLDKEDDDGVDDDIEIDILNEICNDKDDIEDYCDDYIAEVTNWSNIFLYSRLRE